MNPLPATLPDSLRHHLLSARQLTERADTTPSAVCSTGVPALDHLLAGGFHRGQLVELIGRRTCGRYSLVLATLAAATTRGDVAALVDLGDGLDPQNAAAAGVTLERLLWVRPPHLKQALIATEATIGAGFPLVVFDLGFPPIPGGRGTEASWLRLARAASAQKSALLITAPYRVSGTAASAVVRLSGRRPGWSGRRNSPRLLQGLRSHLEIEKLGGHHFSATAQLELATSEELALDSHHPGSTGLGDDRMVHPIPFRHVE